MEEPTRNSTFKAPSGEARRDNEYHVREKGISWRLREEHASERTEWSAVSCVSQKLPRAFDLPQQSRKLFLCLQPGFSIQKWKEKFPGTRRDVSRYVQGSSGELRPMCLKRQKWWGEVEVGLS